MEDEKTVEATPRRPLVAPKRARATACVVRPQHRSPLYWWLSDHHEKLRQAEAKCGGEIPWADLCSDFARAGIAGPDGGAVTARTAKSTWQRVCDERACAGRSDAVMKS